MLKSNILLTISVLLVSSLACNTLAPAVEPTLTMVVIVEPTFPLQQPGIPNNEAEVPRVSLEKALVAYNAGTAVFVDVRSWQSYEVRHIPGALSIPLDEFETDIAGIDLPKGEWIITYCT